MADDSHGSDNVFGRGPKRSGRSRSNRIGRNGSSPEGMDARPVSMDDIRSDPLDLVAVQADDELINALAGGMSVSAPGLGGYDADDQVAAMLAAWKAEVDADPIPEIDLDLATAAVLAGRRPSGRARHLVPIASAAALIVVAITGVSIAAHDTRPGDPLFAISKVLYAEEARSYEALATVEQSQQKARQALAVGDKDAAAAAVAQGQAAAAAVLAEHGAGEVMQDLRQLEVAVAETIPGVPNVVEEEPEPPQTARSGSESSSSSSSEATTSSEASSAAAPAPQDPSSAPADPGGSGGPGAESPGPDSGGTTTASSDPDPAGPPDPTTQPGAGQPGNRAEQPTSGGAPDAGTTGEPAPSPAGPPSEPRPTQPDPAQPGPSQPGPSQPGPSQPDPSQPGPTTQPGPPANQTTGQPAPATTTTPVPGPGGRGGISGASASATGTATPSGQPVTTG